MSFFRELKRRNVFRVGIAYVVVSWLLMQVTDLVFPRIGLEDSAVTLVFALLGIGFFPALIFAWAFEMTPDGIKKEKDVDRSQSIRQNTGRKLDYSIIAVLIVALGYFAYDKFVLTPAEHARALESAIAAEPEEIAKSIAVLPFVNMSEDASNEYFSDGISEEILNSLAKVRELKVAGRSSSFAFKGQSQDLRQIGDTLRVEHILEGSVRKSGNKVRITAQLVRVDTGFHLWSESYDRELDNVFAIQDEISAAIITELKATLLDGEAEAIASTRTDSEAYDLYLLARQRMYERTHMSLKSAAELLDRAIAIDPAYAPAYAQRGITANLLSDTSYGDIPNNQALAHSKLYLDKALELDPNLAEAWAGLGLYYNGPPLQPDQAIPVLEKALAINPNLNDAANWLVLAYWQVNRATDSLALLDSISARDPLYKPALGNRVFQLSWMGRSDEARAQLDAIEPFMPGDPQIEGAHAWIDFAQGAVASGLRRAEDALETQPNDRTYRVSVNQGRFQSHQYEQVTDDHWTDYFVWALFNLDRTEEATIQARKRAADGNIATLFSLLNANSQSELLLEYFEDRWSGLDAFEQEFPASMWGYREMADLAFAFRKSGNQEQFDDAMARLELANASSYSQGIRSGDFLLVYAAYHAMAGDSQAALTHLTAAIDGGLIVSSKISKEYPYFKDLDGNPQYEALQARMIEHLNRERELLGLEPVST